MYGQYWWPKIAKLALFSKSLTNLNPLPPCYYMGSDFSVYCSLCYRSFQFRTPVLDCADVGFIKEFTIKQFQNFTDRRDLFAGEESKLMKYQIFMLQGDHWKHVRSLLTPTFTSGKLKQVKEIINYIIAVASAFTIKCKNILLRWRLHFKYCIL